MFVAEQTTRLDALTVSWINYYKIGNRRSYKLTIVIFIGTYTETIVIIAK